MLSAMLELLVKSAKISVRLSNLNNLLSAYSLIILPWYVYARGGLSKFSN